MSDVSNGSNGRKLPRRQRSIYQVHYGLEARRGPVMAAPLPLRRFTRQVAGHGGDGSEEKYTGLLQCSDGTILKPILKESQKREIEFYERITSSDRPDLVELRKFIPKYYGVRNFTYNGFEQEYIMLEDLTEGMLEPCIMDIKIGRITYDPYASVDKIKREESKYSRCKQQYSFCIPGYQVYRVGGSREGELLRGGKEQGKRLYGDQVVTVIRSFLNAGAGAACRALLLQLLGALWALQKCIARGGTLLRSASLLLVYDAALLRTCCGDGSTPRCRPPQLYRRRSVPAVFPSGGSSFSGQLSPSGPLYPRLSPTPPLSVLSPQPPPSPPVHSSWSEALQRLNNSHAFDNNYQDKLSKMKLEYRARLDKLANCNKNRNPCGTLRIIDFAHAFINNDDDIKVDANFKDGLDSLVSVLEGLLKETDDFVFN